MSLPNDHADAPSLVERGERKQTNCQNEPPFPNYETAVFSLRYPYSVAHAPNQQCRTEEPHLIQDCRWFQSTPDTDRLLEIADNLCSCDDHTADAPDHCDGQYLRDLAARLSPSLPLRDSQPSTEGAGGEDATHWRITANAHVSVMNEAARILGGDDFDDIVALAERAMQRQPLPITREQVIAANALIEQHCPAAESTTGVQCALSDLARWIETNGEYPQYTLPNASAPEEDR